MPAGDLKRVVEGSSTSNSFNDTTSEQEEGAQPAPACPGSLFRFPPGSVLVEDADQEILELYMGLASIDSANETANELAGDPHGQGAGKGSGGLGFFDPSKPVLELQLVLSPSPSPPALASRALIEGAVSVSARRSAHKTTRAKRDLDAARKEREVILPVVVQQDLSALKSRKGDTGSVLWRSSLHLATHILSQSHFPPIPASASASTPSSSVSDPDTLSALLDPDRLRRARVLELGSGTGLLAVLLSPLVQSWTASDLLENLGLVRRNLELNHIDYAGSVHREPTQKKMDHPKDKLAVSPTSPKLSKRALGLSPREEAEAKVRLEEIDWCAVSASKRSHPSADSGGENYNLILAVDCIYNSALVQPLIDTLAHYARPFSSGVEAGNRSQSGEGDRDGEGESEGLGEGTVVWVVVELRESGVMQEFIDQWLADGRKEGEEQGRWRIVRLAEGAMGLWTGGRRGRWVGWVGWRVR